MKTAFKIHGDYFCGKKISDYGIENGFLDYGTLSDSFNHVLNNSIINTMPEYWEMESGFVDNSEEIEELKNRLDEIEITEETMSKFSEIESKISELEEEQENSYNAEVFQWFIVDGNGAEILKDCNEIVYYNSELDMYLWGVTHWGTAWDMVLTDVPCCVGYDI